MLAISLGAALPFMVGRIADFAGLAAAFAIPAVAYLAISLFAWRAALAGPAPVSHEVRT